MSKGKIGILASGRGSNLQAILEAIAMGDLNVDIAVVISDKSEAFALKRAEEAGINNYAVVRKEFSSIAEFEDSIDELLRKHGVELIVLAGFMRILSGNFIEKWKEKIINIHPALLPSFPGLDAQGQALAYGVKVAGCTVHFVDEGMDSGPIILQKVVPVLPDDDHDTLAARILQEEHQALPEVIGLWAEKKIAVNGRVVRILK